MTRAPYELFVQLPVFLSMHDEAVLFGWLEEIKGVKDVHGEGTGVRVVFRRAHLSDDDLRELLALFCRYGMEMRDLARFETPRNRKWFRVPGKYWHARVFGK